MYFRASTVQFFKVNSLLWSELFSFYYVNNFACIYIEYATKNLTLLASLIVYEESLEKHAFSEVSMPIL